jgi:hypothetical protein
MRNRSLSNSGRSFLGATNMERRAFLRLLQRGFLGSLALSFGPAVLPAFAVDPATVVLLVNTAISVAKLFSQGPGIGDLLRLQVEMLKAISAQLAAVQRGVLEILNRLDQIEALIGQIPEKVVIELYRAKVAGLNGRYTEIIATYKADLDKHGIEYAQKTNGHELETELLRPLRGARDILMSYSSFSLVPIVCSASFVETHAMIMANYRHSRMLEAMHRYHDWLTLVSEGSTEATLSGAIAVTQKNQAQDKGRIPGPEAYECYAQLRMYGPGESSCAQGRYPMASGSYKNIHFTPTVQETIDPDVDKAVEDMIKSGVLPKEERPLKISIDFAQPENTFVACPIDRVVVPPGKDRAWLTAIMKTPCPDLTGKVADTQQLSPKLTQDGLRLMSLRALKSASDDGLAFLQRMEKSVNAQPESGFNEATSFENPRFHPDGQHARLWRCSGEKDRPVRPDRSQ